MVDFSKIVQNRSVRRAVEQSALERVYQDSMLGTPYGRLLIRTPRARRRLAWLRFRAWLSSWLPRLRHAWAALRDVDCEHHEEG